MNAPRLQEQAVLQIKKPVLQVNSINKSFGGLQALSSVTLQVNQGEIIALIGPNGAGKTTLFNCISCLYTPESGKICLTTPEGRQHQLVGSKPYQATKLGMARTFQNIRLFPVMTALENVMIARHCRTHTGVLGALLRSQRVRREEQEIEDKSYQLLQYLQLDQFYNDQARNLAYGQQRRLEIARALATEPFLLLLDEPAAGMNPQETQELKQLLLQIRQDFQLSVLLIEHDMSMVMSLSDRIYVMEQGRNIADGLPWEVRDNSEVIRAYLGEENA